MKQHTDHKPPKLASKLFTWYSGNAAIEDLEGDLEELFHADLERVSARRARLRYWKRMASLLFSYAVRKRKARYGSNRYSSTSNHPAMIKNYVKVAWRNLLRHKGYSFINITGLATGMAVTVLIGLWIWDEVSFNTYHKRYDRLGQLYQFVTFETAKIPYGDKSMPVPLAEELRSQYPEFKSVSLSSGMIQAVLANGEKKFTKDGMYVEPVFPEMISLSMEQGSYTELADMNTILLSASLARELFQNEDPIHKVIVLDNSISVSVGGVYTDLPDNSDFRDIRFIAAWKLYASKDFVKRALDQWDENGNSIYVELAQGVPFPEISARIRDIRMKRPDPPGYRPEFFVHPMRYWHLRTSWDNGVLSGGKIQYVWLFGGIGLFILLLACINFMNLSTARSEKRAKEVGIRSTVGSARRQLVLQFFSESMVMVALAFVLAMIVVQLSLPVFNSLAGKLITIPWANPWFWIAGISFVVFTGLIAGSYPAIYLSSFKPINILKGTFRAGKFAAVPRKVLVVLQFTVSLTLIIGTIVVFRQVEYAKDRPSGYSRDRLIEVMMNTPDLRGHYDVLRQDLLGTGVVYECAQSSNSLTSSAGGTTDISWTGKNAEQQPIFISIASTHEFGKTIGWELVEGRDFSRNYVTDSTAMIINESALKLMGLKKPLEEPVKLRGREYHIVGITKDMIRQSPFERIQPTIFTLNYNAVNVISVKLSSTIGLHQAISRIEKVFKKYNPGSPFDFTFVNENYAKKFVDEGRISQLVAVFATLAIFISCLGIFGLASFVAEQRTKEIGVRKVLGASILALWGMLSREFVQLMLLSLFIAIPLAWYFMNDWLQRYDYHTTISWWIFVISGASVFAITLLTVSYQSIKAAAANPIKSLRTE